MKFNSIKKNKYRFNIKRNKRIKRNNCKEKEKIKKVEMKRTFQQTSDGNDRDNDGDAQVKIVHLNEQKRPGGFYGGKGIGVQTIQPQPEIPIVDTNSDPTVKNVTIIQKRGGGSRKECQNCLKPNSTFRICTREWLCADCKELDEFKLLTRTRVVEMYDLTVAQLIEAYKQGVIQMFTIDNSKGKYPVRLYYKREVEALDKALRPVTAKLRAAAAQNQ